MARTRRPRRAASRTRSTGASVPSDAVVCEWRSTGPATPPALGLAAERREVRQHRPHGDAGGALGPERVVALGERRARDVHVGPRNPPREVAHEQPGDDGPRPALARDIVE